MKSVFVNGRVAIVVRYWEEPPLPDAPGIVEVGARVEVRRVEQVVGRAHRPGAAGLTVRPISDGGIWRADLFVALTSPPAPRFHYHAQFGDDEVGPRTFLAEGVDPRAWAADRLADLPRLLVDHGAQDLVSSVDVRQHELSLPLMLAAIEACLARVPGRLFGVPA